MLLRRTKSDSEASRRRRLVQKSLQGKHGRKTELVRYFNCVSGSIPEEGDGPFTTVEKTVTVTSAEEILNIDTESTQSQLDLQDSRNVRTAPPTPEVESKAFPRHAESTSHLEMATPSIPVTTTTATTPSPSSQALPVTIPGGPGKKPRETANVKGSDIVSSGQKSPHKEVSPKITKSRNDKFHKLFKSIPHDEILHNAYSCAYFGDILLQGYLYISPNWFCFYSKILAHQKLIQIPVSSVINITREKTAFIIPNAIKVRTADEKFVFGSLISRDNTYKLMLSIWKKARAGFLSSQGVSPIDMDVSDGLTITYDGGNSGNENNNIMKPTIELTPNTSFDTSGTDDSNSNLCLECEDSSHNHQGEYSEDQRNNQSSRSKKKKVPTATLR